MNIFDIPLHPAADVFPMLDEEELEELALDIKANGLQQPLVISEQNGVPRLVDGRNRREACRRAGVVPDYVLLDGQDPIAYIVSANITRRHMSKGQRAIVIARIYPEPKRGIHSEFPEETGELSKAHLSRARFVMRYASDLADSVRDGSISLNNAYEEARLRKGRAETHESRFNALKAAAPDLADMVTDGQLQLAEAEAAYRERQERIHRDKILLAEALHDMAKHAYLLESQREQVAEFVVSEAELYQQQNPDPIDEVVHALEVFAEHAATLPSASGCGVWTRV